jgi:hypothetical protein
MGWSFTTHKDYLQLVAVSNHEKPSYSKESTINSYAWYFQAIPSKFSCTIFQKKNLPNTSHFVTLFLAHGDVVVGFAIFHIVLFQKNKGKKRKEKRHSSMVCEIWWAPDGIG